MADVPSLPNQIADELKALAIFAVLASRVLVNWIYGGRQVKRLAI